MTNFLVIPDKFKGSLTAKEVINAISKGIKKADTTSCIHTIIASDGGDGFLDAISNILKVEEITISTLDPLGRKIDAPYLYNLKTKTAYIELAKASGLTLLQEQERNPIPTSTYGTGLQIKHAIKKGATSIYIGLGGSATNDGGIGIAKALGYNFLDVNGQELAPTGGNLSKINTIQKKTALEKIEGISFFAVNDVNNPLFGTKGAAFVYGEQKGASKEEIYILDKGLMYLNKIVGKELQKDFAFIPGTGAAGGAAYGLKTFFDANYLSGVDFLLQLAEVPKIIETQKIDYIITGEGKIDSQTIHGKLVKGVIKMAKKYNIPVIAICGKLDIDAKELEKLGIEKVIQTYNPSMGVEYSMNNASVIIEELMANYFKGIH